MASDNAGYPYGHGAQYSPSSYYTQSRAPSARGGGYREAYPMDYSTSSRSRHENNTYTSSRDPYVYTSGHSSSRAERRGAGSSYSMHSRSYRDDVPSPPAQDVPQQIQLAKIRCDRDMKDLMDPLTLLLLYEWCMTEEGFFDPGEFIFACEAIPIKRDRHGHLRPIRVEGAEWGVKTQYDPSFDMYLPTIFIDIPSALSHVSSTGMRAAYKRMAAEPRSDNLKTAKEFPFKDHPRYRFYAVLFKHKGEGKARLFDDYVSEDAVVRI
ncbi:hypothetical protein F4802DRAFT_595064 [Xylaria palmicola]|nr:hypothetical protein F4802DRAFT_595064 [Xylaria palmicola]